MTEQEKQAEIENLQIQVNGAVGYLVTLRKVARDYGSEDLYPMFADMTVKSLLDCYEALAALRGY